MTTVIGVTCDMDWTPTPQGLLDSPCGEPATTTAQLSGIEYNACRSCATWLATRPRAATETVDLPAPDGYGPPPIGQLNRVPFWTDPEDKHQRWTARPGGVDDGTGYLRPVASVRAVALVMLAVCAESDRLANQAAVTR